MNNPNPFVPKGSILELQSKRRSRLKLAVFCVLAVGVAGLSAMLIQGCKREQPTETADISAPTIDTNPPAMTGTNPPAIDTNPPVVVPPVVANPIPPVVVPPVEPAGTEYTVAKGDSLAKIAKKNGVTLKALEAANPGVIPTKLKVGQKLVIPAGGSAAVSSTAPAAAMDSASTSSVGEIYTVKSGDTLTRIAKHFGISIKALESANGLTTSGIKVGQKLKVPAKAGTAAPAAAAPEPAVMAPVAAPVVPPPVAPETIPAK